MKKESLNECPHCKAHKARVVDSRRNTPTCRKRRFKCMACKARWNTYEITTGVPGAVEVPAELLVQLKQYLLTKPDISKGVGLELATNAELLQELLKREDK